MNAQEIEQELAQEKTDRAEELAKDRVDYAKLMRKSIKHAMIEKGIRVTELAAQSGMSQSNLSMYLNGNKDCTAASWAKMLSSITDGEVDMFAAVVKIKTAANA